MLCACVSRHYSDPARLLVERRIAARVPRPWLREGRRERSPGSASRAASSNRFRTQHRPRYGGAGRLWCRGPYVAMPAISTRRFGFNPTIVSTDPRLPNGVSGDGHPDWVSGAKHSVPHAARIAERNLRHLVDRDVERGVRCRSPGQLPCQSSPTSSKGHVRWLTASVGSILRHLAAGSTEMNAVESPASSGFLTTSHH
jgi:hypothetical protein